MSTVLVPLDGSGFAEHAIPVALGIARRSGGRVELVAVHEPAALLHGIHGSPMHDFALEQSRDAAVRRQLAHYLEETQRRLAASDADVPVGTAVLDGSAAEQLADHIRQTSPDLVVMTTHGRGGVSRMWLGSVTEGLVRRATVPVLALRLLEGTASPDQPSDIRRVLVAVDGSPESEAVIAPVAGLLGTAGVAYTVMRVVPPLHPLVRAVATDWEYSRDLGQEHRLANHYLHDLADRLRPAGLTVSVAARSDVAPAQAIAAAAAELRADVVVLGTHGRGPMGRLVFGSVADKVLRTAPTAVLLYHMPRTQRHEGATAQQAAGASRG